MLSKRQMFSTVVLLSSLAAGRGAWAQAPKTSDSAAFARLDSTIARIVRDQHVVGLAIGVGRDSQLVFARGYGVRRLGGSAPITPRSLFHMASVTKPFVATAVMQLVERGKVALDSPVVRYLPYFSVRDLARNRITIRQLLNHTSGMRDVTDYQWDHPETDDGALERYVRALKDSTLLWAPGTKFQYSNIGFEILADVIAKVSGTPFEQYMRRHILVPLGMRSSNLQKPLADTALLTTPHHTDSAGRNTVSPVFPYNRPHAASSTLLSNVEDMSRWARVNLGKGTLDGKKILEAASYDELWKPTVATGRNGGPIDRSHVGLSWFIGSFEGHPLVSHNGGDVGYVTFVGLAPDDGAFVVVMVNSEQGRVLSDVVVAALKAAVGRD